MMEDFKTKAGNLTDSISDYVQTNYKLAVINAADKATTIAAGTMASIVVLFLGTFVLLFASLALGVWLGDLLESRALGYVIVAAFYTLVILIIVAMRKRIVFPMIRDSLIRKLYEQNNQDLQ
jgi:hypothetical protein